MVEIGDEPLLFAGERRFDHRPPIGVGFFADYLRHGLAEDRLARLLKPVGQRSVDEGVALLAIEIGNHHRQRVRDRQDPGKTDGAGKNGRKARGCPDVDDCRIDRWHRLHFAVRRFYLPPVRHEAKLLRFAARVTRTVDNPN